MLIRDRDRDGGVVQLDRLFDRSDTATPAGSTLSSLISGNPAKRVAPESARELMLILKRIPVII